MLSCVISSLPVDMRRLKKPMLAAGPPLLFGLRMWASVSLALYVAFWLELDNPFWAGTSAAIVCQPHLGASLRKGWYRMIGTLVGAIAIVLLSFRLLPPLSPAYRARRLLALTLRDLRRLATGRAHSHWG